MKKIIQTLAPICALALALATPALAAPKDRYLHIRVEDSAHGESVNVNLPLSMAERVLPAVNHGNLHQGRVTISHADMDGIDVPALLDAIHTAPDNEFVTVKKHDQKVRVAKMNGNLVVHVTEGGKDSKDPHKMEITVPMKVVDALFSTAKKDELDIAAAIRALSAAGDTLLVTVHDATQHVRIWVDSRGSSE
jgi:hypothetical protein